MIRADHIELSKAVGLKANPKLHDIGSIHVSLQRFGFLERILINEETGHILSGHGRIETLRKMKVQGGTPPVGIEILGDEWCVPCDYVKLAEREEEAAAIALNRLVESGGWDENMLTKILSDLAAQGAENLEGIGFDVDDLDRMLDDLNGPEERGSDSLEENEMGDYGEFAIEMGKKWGTEDGDIWQVGEHIVACGSCRDREFVQEVFGERRAHVVMTSPPYALQRKKQYGGISAEDYVEWWADVQANIASFITDDGSFFLNIKPHTEDGQRTLYVSDLVSSMVREHDWMLVDEFCWQRLGAPGKWKNRFKNGFEPVYHFAKIADIKFNPKSVSSGSSGLASHGGNRSTGNYYNMAHKEMAWDSALPSNLLPTFGNAQGWGQAAAYPPGLPEFFILAFSDHGDLVYDPFAGSGTTGVAAHINGRKSVAIEKLPEYTAIILERMLEITSLEPEKIGKTERADKTEV